MAGDAETALRLVLSEKKFVYNQRKKVKYLNAACSFDIETSSFYEGDEKRAIMYIWSFAVDNTVIIGRSWEEYEELLALLRKILGLDDERLIVIYVHNLAYEFQFLQRRHEWQKVFALRERKPIYATTSGVEYRCSYLLSGYSLSVLGGKLRRPVKKLLGDLDYTLLRHGETRLSETELGYCANDVLIVTEYINECIEDEGRIDNIPMTKTGYVRRYCRGQCYPSGKYNIKLRKKYSEMIHGLTIEPEEYKQLKRAFQGGFTHASAWYSGKVMSNVTSYDFTSSYPAVMVAEKFPMSKGVLVENPTEEYFNLALSKYCCVFDVTFRAICSRGLTEHYISASKCWKVRGQGEDNGRIISAETLTTTITDVDYSIIRRVYDWGEMEVRNLTVYRRDYLPTPFVASVLSLYNDKTTLKGVEGREEEYAKKKEMLNSCYGMCVTDICRPENTYTDRWKTTNPNVSDAIAKYNSGRQRFLSYAWGVWVTAYARANLWTGILECGEDYIYSDTDSIKCRNMEKHMDYINRYNEGITAKIDRALRHHGLPSELGRPKTVKGEEKPIGVWDYDGHYELFKTLGAKRYLVVLDGDLALTVSGLNKHIVVPWLLEQCRGDVDEVFGRFTDCLYIPKGVTGKNTHTYIDEPHHGRVRDYEGVWGDYDEKSAVHMEEADYSLSLARAYADYIRQVQYAVD